MLEVRAPGIAGWFVISLIAVVVELLFFPFSKIWMVLLFLLLGAFFLVAFVVILLGYWVIGAVVVMAVRRRVQAFALWNTTRAKGRPSENWRWAGQGNGVWDRWLDGP